MKRHLNISVAFAAALFLLFCCEEDADLTVLKKVNFTSSPQASADNIVVTEENKGETLLRVSWPEISFPVEGPVTYTLQFETPNDTVGANAWAEAVKKEVGEDLLSTSYSGAELNEIALALGIAPGAEGTIVFRVQGAMSRNIFSKGTSLRLTSIDVPAIIDYPSLYIAGDYQGWNIGAPSKISSVNDDSQYEGYIYIPEGGTNEFKLYAQPDWGPTSYGFESEGKIMVANFAGANFVAPSDGYYWFAVNLNTMEYALVKTEWGIIGGATPGSWDASTQMQYNAESQKWTVTANLTADALKFRANNGWDIQFGNLDGKLSYADHPLMEYVDLPAFTIPSAGSYTVTLDLHIPGNYSYQIKKN
ncbi:MAG: SusE domain-containing protein [Chryseolinea sp.]